MPGRSRRSKKSYQPRGQESTPGSLPRQPHDGVHLLMFGTPGQDRFQFMWNDLVRGAIGAVVMVDTLRLADSFPAVDYFEQTGIPFIVAVNCFDGVARHPVEKVREA